MIYDVSHKTTYRYTAPVVQSRHNIHLSPREVAHQKILGHALTIDPTPSERFDHLDYFGNPVSLVVVEEDHNHLTMESVSQIEVNAVLLPDLSLSAPWEQVSVHAEKSPALVDLDVAQYTSSSRLVPVRNETQAYAQPSFPSGRPVLEGVLDLTSRVYNEFDYDPVATDVTTPIDTVLQERRGVCQDFAHLQISCLRSLGLPARYVSGYLLTHPKEGEAKLEGADASHAWISVWAPEIGWVDFDPTNNMIPTNEHITLAYGRDFDDVSPISGVLLGGGSHSITVEVDVRAAASLK